MPRYTTEKLTIPVAIAEQANRCAAVFDPDVGGADTFGACGLSATGEAPATHYMCSTAIKPAYLPMLQNAEAAYPALVALAQDYGRDAPTQSDVEAFCGAVIVGEPEGLVRIVEQDPAA